jgi:hypothetical protein
MDFIPLKSTITIQQNISEYHVGKVLKGKMAINQEGRFGYLAMNFKNKKFYNVGIHIDCPPEDKVK